MTWNPNTPPVATPTLTGAEVGLFARYNFYVGGYHNGTINMQEPGLLTQRYTGELRPLWPVARP